MAPGNTLNTHRDMIEQYIEENEPIVISVNFVPDYVKALCFFGNQKRYNMAKRKRENRNIIISSNVRSDNEKDLIINYHSLINRGYKYFDNSTIMLLQMLKRLTPSKITIAGFDGFDITSSQNYADMSFQNERHVNEFEVLNHEIKEMFGEICEKLAGKCDISIITPSRYRRNER